ncbi:hypothetical protein EVAR_32312_1 [Eumeta japonica]|uniref:Uncharacterized protein n=1 Tax=Eumeta variegata TaxID=151549 RepID=A0A4C1Z7Y4_EUMVA|nr:hypothetical protein EVAR_32312_1 [Eumeta japonica]
MMMYLRASVYASSWFLISSDLAAVRPIRHEASLVCCCTQFLLACIATELTSGRPKREIPPRPPSAPLCREHPYAPTYQNNNKLNTNNDREMALLYSKNWVSGRAYRSARNAVPLGTRHNAPAPRPLSAISME